MNALCRGRVCSCVLLFVNYYQIFFEPVLKFSMTDFTEICPDFRPHSSEIKPGSHELIIGLFHVSHKPLHEYARKFIGEIITSTYREITI
jgi:hypothetical protein